MHVHVSTSRALRIATLVLALCPATASAHNYYVGGAGASDANAGTSGAPFATIQHAANLAGVGDSVDVRAGTYAGFLITGTGTSLAWLVYHGEAGATVNSPATTGLNHNVVIHIEGSASDRHEYIVIEGFTVDPSGGTAGRSCVGMQCDQEGVGHVIVRNCTLRNPLTWGIFTGYVGDMLLENNICDGAAQQHGIYVGNSADRITIRGNICRNNHDCGIQDNADPSLPGDHVSSECVFENNFCSGNGVGGGAAINMASVRHSIFRNNVLVGNLAGGIAMWDNATDTMWGSKDNDICGNTIVQASTGRYCINLQNGSHGNSFHNNILFHPGTRGCFDIGSDCLPIYSDYNILGDDGTTSLDGIVGTLATWRTQTSGDAHSFVVATTAALFIDPAGGDYHLLATSPARNAGITDTALLVDRDGVSRSSGTGPDIGAYEYPEAVSVISEQALNVPPLRRLDAIGGRVLRAEPAIGAPSRLGLLDVNGREVWHAEVAARSTQIALPAMLASGMYFARLTGPGESRLAMVTITR